MTKHLKRLGATLSLLVLLSPLAAHAAVDRAVVAGLTEGSGSGLGVFAADTHFFDGSTDVGSYFVDLPTGGVTTEQGLLNAATTAITSYATAHGYTLTNGIIWPYLSTNQIDAKIGAATSSVTSAYQAAIAAAIPAAATSYQTIVSQTGTAAPAVSGGFTPMSSYASSTTFTWARTGAGTYTLTASAASFSTTGKTGVFIAPLNNLNGSVRAVVTSSTVITFTTAVQSLAALGLLPLTATPTDALLSSTMIYVQTYP